jgi:hypothetical protein
LTNEQSRWITTALGVEVASNRKAARFFKEFKEWQAAIIYIETCAAMLEEAFENLTTDQQCDFDWYLAIEACGESIIKGNHSDTSVSKGLSAGVTS